LIRELDPLIHQRVKFKRRQFCAVQVLGDLPRTGGTSPYVHLVSSFFFQFF
jgi:hypothetical protein